MTAFHRDLGGEVEAYAAYLNAPRGVLDQEEQLLFDEDMARARAAMERAWLEATPVQAAAPEPDVSTATAGESWFVEVVTAFKRGVRRAFARA